MTAADRNADTRARIIAAADRLYQQANRETFPPVDAVRREARADMNITSTVMKEWRRMQTATPTPVAVTIPAKVQEASAAALAAVWAEAQVIANEALQAARESWEQERNDVDVMRAELAAAYEAQAAELEASTDNLARARQAIDAEQGKGAALAAELAEAKEHARTADARAEEIARRADAAEARAQAAEQQQQASAAELDAARHQLAELAAEVAALKARAEAAAEEAHRAGQRLQRIEADRDDARQQASAAREDAANVRGQLEAIREQSTALMLRVGIPAAETTAAAPKTGQKTAKAAAPKKGAAA